MKCNSHPHEHGGGVCASCLRDRLLVLLAAQRNPNPYPSPETHHLRLSAEETKTFGNRCHRFSLFPSLFGSDDSETSSWFSALIHRKKKKIDKEKRARTSDRGVSPAMHGQDGSDSNAYVSGYSTDTAAGFRRRTNPARAVPDHRRLINSVGHGFSEFVVCLSPLVRTGHAGLRNHQPPQPETSFSDDLGRIGNPVKPNRSRKLAGSGRFR